MAGAGFYPQGHPNVEIAYYLLSTAMSAEGFNTVVRSHWGIENHLHWRPEVIMNEDQDRTEWKKASSLRDPASHGAMIQNGDKGVCDGFAQESKPGAAGRGALDAGCG
jgi:hypothetical protein